MTDTSEGLDTRPVIWFTMTMENSAAPKLACRRCGALVSTTYFVTIQGGARTFSGNGTHRPGYCRSCAKDRVGEMNAVDETKRVANGGTPR